MLRDVPRFVAAFPDDEFYCPPDHSLLDPWIARLGLAAEWQKLTG